MTQLREEKTAQLTRLSELPPSAEYEFDAGDSLPSASSPSLVLNTRTRTVVSLQWSTFRAKETTRVERTDGTETVRRSSELASIVPRGGSYAYDLIAEVGCATFLQGRRLRDIREELPPSKSGGPIAFSSLQDIQYKFLLYLGEVHRQAAPRLAEHFKERGGISWLVDGTLEPGSPVFFGIREPEEHIMLGSWKIATENSDDIARCLGWAEGVYGRPNQVLRDLSERVRQGIGKALPEVPQYVCHYHFAADVGRDLYRGPQELLHKRLRALKLQSDLKSQRSHQTQCVRRALRDGQTSLVLEELLAGRPVAASRDGTLRREALIALHEWILDYQQDGTRQGPPFDPYVLYRHRRIVEAHEVARRLLSAEPCGSRQKTGLTHFVEKLDRYVKDPEIITAAETYEKAFEIFGRLRSTLRLDPRDDTPLADAYAVSDEQRQSINADIRRLRNEYVQEREQCTDASRSELYEIVLAHLDRHAPFLLPVDGAGSSGPRVRTTGDLESTWRDRKRNRRRTTGRRKLTRDFTALPAEIMLVPNLKSSRYVQLVMGDLDRLPAKLAEAGKTAPPFTRWRAENRTRGVARLPRRMLRDDDFLDNLITVWAVQPGSL